MHAPLPAPKCPRPNPRICESTTFQGKRHFVDVIKALQMGDDPGLPSGLRYHKDPSPKEAGWGGGRLEEDTGGVAQKRRERTDVTPVALREETTSRGM